MILSVATRIIETKGINSGNKIILLVIAVLRGGDIGIFFKKKLKRRIILSFTGSCDVV